MTFRLKPRNLPLTSLGLVLLLLLSHIAFDAQFSQWRGRTFDTYQVVDLAWYENFPFYADLFGDPAPPSPVVLVTIDEAALATHGRWPWSRALVANLIRAIDRNGAAVIGLDLLFPEPDATLNGRASDNALVAALADTTSVLAASLAETPTSVEMRTKAGYSVVGRADENWPGYPGVTGSLVAMNEAATGIGVIRSRADPDGVLRRLPLAWVREVGTDYEMWPAFALELVRVYIGEPSFDIRMGASGFELFRFSRSRARIPLEPDGAVWLVENKLPIPAVSAASLMAGESAPILRDAIAIVSFNAVGLDTFHHTPARTQRLGTEVHAILANQLLAGQYLHEHDDAKVIERAVFAVLALLVLALVGLGSRRPGVALPLLTVVVAAPLVAGFLAFEYRGELFESVQPAIGLFLIAAAEGFSLFRRSEQRRQSLTRQFSRFLSPEVVRALAAGDSDAILSVDKREITVMMIDLRGFTTMTNALDAAQTVDLVNHFLSLATSEIFRRRGTVDKFIGDAVLSFWNAPLDEPRHADLAIEAAEAILDRIEERNPEIVARGLPALKVGAALETGICSVGNFGSTLRIDYTAIGATVNAAARLETATKILGVPLVTGPGFAARTSRDLVGIGEVELRGFAEPVKVFTTPVHARRRMAMRAGAAI